MSIRSFFLLKIPPNVYRHLGSLLWGVLNRQKVAAKQFKIVRVTAYKIIPHPDVRVLMHAIFFLVFTKKKLDIYIFFALSVYQHLLFTDTVPGGGAWPWWSRQEVETHTCQHECPAGQHARTHMRTHRPRGHTCNVTFHSRCNYSPNSEPRNIFFFSEKC